MSGWEELGTDPEWLDQVRRRPVGAVPWPRARRHPLQDVEQAMAEVNNARESGSTGRPLMSGGNGGPYGREDSGEREQYDSGMVRDSIRGKVLTEAHDLITGDRNNQYGPPTQDFQRTAEILNAIGYRRPGGKGLQPHDVAVIQIALKMSRVTWTPDKRDSWVDIAGYAACGYECADEQGQVNNGD